MEILRVPEVELNEMSEPRDDCEPIEVLGNDKQIVDVYVTEDIEVNSFKRVRFIAKLGHTEDNLDALSIWLYVVNKNDYKRDLLITIL